MVYSKLARVAVLGSAICMLFGSQQTASQEPLQGKTAAVTVIDGLVYPKAVKDGDGKAVENTGAVAKYDIDDDVNKVIGWYMAKLVPRIQLGKDEVPVTDFIQGNFASGVMEGTVKGNTRKLAFNVVKTDTVHLWVATSTFSEAGVEKYATTVTVSRAKADKATKVTVSVILASSSKK